MQPGQWPCAWAAKEALREHHRELVKLPLQDLLPDLFGDGLITEETQERILHPRAVFVKREANQLILHDVREAVSNQSECFDRFLRSLQSLQPAVGLSQRIKGMHIMVLPKLHAVHQNRIHQFEVIRARCRH